MTKEYSYKAINEFGTMIHLSITSEYDYQDQTEKEYLLTDNYSIIEESYDTETEDIDAVVIMKKMNGIVQKFRKPSVKFRKPMKLKIVFTNGDVEIVNRIDLMNRYEVSNIKYGNYNQGQDLYDLYCVKSIERVTNTTSKTTLGSDSRAFETMSDTLTRALDILN